MPLDPYAIAFFFGFGLLSTLLELLRPARRIDYRRVVPNDVLACAAFQLVFGPAAVAITARLVAPHLAGVGVLAPLPLGLRVVLYVVANDFLTYWAHRAMHSRHLWRVHRFHHSPTEMYWLAGVRGTFPQQLVYSVSAACCVPLLSGAPTWLVLGVVASGFVLNDAMHLNVTWRSTWLERVLVTPRYHHVHHSADARHHAANLGSLLTVWDRLFGTYVDPGEVGPLRFGTHESRHPLLVALGV